MNISIEKVQPHHALMISELAVRSKAHWGYSVQFMQQVMAELTYTVEDLQRHDTFLARVDGQLAGFYQLRELDLFTVELDALFVDPEFIGQGIGSSMFAHSTSKAKNKNYHTLSIQSDPFAADFYRKQGCVMTGELASLSIPGRMLPLFKYVLS